MLRPLKFLALALMLGLAMVYGSPGKAYASPHAPAMAPLSTALIGDIDTALASGDPAAALLQLMLKNPRQIGQIAAYVRKKDPNLETIVDGAVRLAKRTVPPCLERKYSSRNHCRSPLPGPQFWNTVENPSTMSNTNL